MVEGANLLFVKKLAKNCLKMEKLDQEGDAHP